MKNFSLLCSRQSYQNKYNKEKDIIKFYDAIIIKI